MGLGAQQPAAPVLVKCAQRTGELADGLATLRRRLGLHQVGDRLDRGEIQLAILKGAPAELPRFRRPQAGEAAGPDAMVLLLSAPAAMSFYPRIGMPKAENAFIFPRRR